jgi:hypothetical protein
MFEYLYIYGKYIETNLTFLTLLDTLLTSVLHPPPFFIKKKSVFTTLGIIRGIKHRSCLKKHTLSDLEASCPNTQV